MRTCEVTGCDRKHFGGGLCNAHYQRKRRGKSLDTPLRFNRPNGQTEIRKAGKKHCPSCDRWLDETHYSAHAKTRDKLQVNCHECVNASRVLALYGLSGAGIAEKLKEQDHKCPICSVGLEKWVVDHDHSCCPGPQSCGRCVRGLLCRTCNLGLGSFRDNPTALQRAIDYLKEAQQ